MTSWMWDLALFGWGFLAGFGVAVAVVMVARMYRDARHGGEELLSHLGPIESRRFIRVVSE